MRGNVIRSSSGDDLDNAQTLGRRQMRDGVGRCRRKGKLGREEEIMYMEGGLTYPIGKARYMELPTQWRKASPLTLWISTFISTATGDIPITRRLCCTLS
jgi:hypothetical protein